MTDAYEIGIHLLLQDDVSAGLAVINRGLAEVDRAIAATTAKLAGMVKEAERASAAVVAASSNRLTIGDEKAATAPAGTETVREKTTIEIRDAVPATAHQEEGAAPVPSGPAPPTSLPAVDTAKVSEEVPSALAPTLGAVAVRSDVAKPAVVAGPVEIERRPESPVATMTEALTLPPRAAAHPALPGVAPAEPLAARVSSAEATKVAVAPVREAGIVAQAFQPRPVPAQAAVSAPASRREGTVAPPTGSAGRRRAVEPAREANAQPTRSNDCARQSGGGLVMLDGRVVGQWLSEHMGREASRPPSGTSFFDPRQTPAWNISGAV